MIWDLVWLGVLGLAIIVCYALQLRSMRRP